MRFFFLFLSIVIAFAAPVSAGPDTQNSDPAAASDAGARIYKAHSDALYQIQVIDRASGKPIPLPAAVHAACA